MRRWLSLWLPAWPIERMALARHRRGEALPLSRPFALVHPDHGVPRLSAVNEAARGKGLEPGLNLTDARAILPDLAVRNAEPEADVKALEALSLWCGRWSPRVAADGLDGILLDLTGCAHLFGGEAGVLQDVERRFTALGLTVRAAIASRRLAAWGWARFGAGGILGEDERARRLAELPVAALRLAPELVAALGRLGFRCVGQLAGLPHSSLLTRFGRELVAHLDSLEDDEDEPFIPLRPPMRFMARLTLAEPIGRTEDIERAAQRLLLDVCHGLDHAQEGARRIRLGLHRVDGEVARIEVGTGRPVRDPAHLFRLLRLRLDGIDVGFGVELMLLEACETAPLEAAQSGLAEEADEVALTRLADGLAVRLGQERVLRLQPVESHIPERAQRFVFGADAIEMLPWLAAVPRPLRLFDRPRPVTAIAPVPDGPPVRIALDCLPLRILEATGPERILPEWWRSEDDGRRLRDYYRVTCEDGRSLWVFREGSYGEAQVPEWRVHGSFD